MSGRPLVVGGVAALVVGGLLLVLGLGPERGGAEPTTASSVTRVVAQGTRTSPSPVPRATTTAPALGTTEGRPLPEAGSMPRTVASTALPPAVSGLRLEVPSIGLDLAVKAGGVSASGRIVPPAGRATWVRGFGRVEPGAVGTAVVAGHVSAYGKRDVFADLSSVRVGHELLVRSGSDVRTYAVTRVRVVDKADLTRDAEVWGENGSQRRLVLITCDDDLGFRKDGHRVANYVVVAEAT
ncbi:class F sortase [Knoellia sp. CPCC 206450]|uniref:class F sortase n=1 Tax=Knoellia tibetensis TaxID=3404798 RepID=UPI003B438924